MIIRRLRWALRRLLCRHPVLMVLGCQREGNHIRCMECRREWRHDEAVGVDVPTLLDLIKDLRDAEECHRNMAAEAIQALARKPLMYPIPEPSVN